MKRAVFMGSDTFSTPVLAALLESGERLTVPVTVAAVVTQPDRPTGRGRRLAAGPVKALAESKGVPVLQPERVRNADSAAEILSLQPDLIVVASYGQILPRTLLDTPPGHALNLHPSLLPRYRGSSPIATPILEGERRTGTTLMLMTPRMDAGPILDQRAVQIGPDETAGELGARLADLSAALLLEDLPAWLEGRIEPRPQDDADATYTERISKEQGLVDWNLSAEQIRRHTLAFTPWPGSFTSWNGRQLKLLQVDARSGRAAPGEVWVENGELIVGTGDGLLGVRRLQPAGGKPASAADFVRGHPDIAGTRLGH
jgi:methionyl-tRNA formyltransferase